MRNLLLIVLLLILGIGGYAYYKDPTGCQKLASDVTADSTAIFVAIKPPGVAPAPGTPPPATASPNNPAAPPPLPTVAPISPAPAPAPPATPSSTSTAAPVQYPVGYAFPR